MIKLKGMTWDHPRGFDPMIATSEVFKKKSNMNFILKGWNEYLAEYLKKKDINIMKKESNQLLTKLNEESYLKFKKYNLNLKKK